MVPQGSFPIFKSLKMLWFFVLNISYVLLKPQGFQWMKALDLNTSYYTIRLDPNAGKLWTIYKRLPMSKAGLLHIFQLKMPYLIGVLEYVRVYSSYL